MRLTLLFVLVLCCSASVVFGNAEPEVKKVTEQFYDQYREVTESGADAWVAKSKYLSPEFKAAYAAAIASGKLNYDPITSSQDNGDYGLDLKATEISVKGETATAAMVRRKTPSYKVDPLKVSLVLRNGKWLINGIENLVGK